MPFLKFDRSRSLAVLYRGAAQKKEGRAHVANVTANYHEVSVATSQVKFPNILNKNDLKMFHESNDCQILKTVSLKNYLIFQFQFHDRFNDRWY